MERKIGEIFDYNGEWYQCIEGYNCTDCDLRNIICHRDIETFPFNICVGAYRKDNTSVIFKKLEKVGEPYRRWLSPSNNIMVQRYRLYGRNVIMPDEPYMYFNAIDNTIEIELKQNKEDMKEKKLNLKPFDIQKAREGKPVCTRDGRKARIICYDRQSDHGFPLVVLVENTGAEKDEDVHFYRANGTAATAERAQDLMMLPEKKEGWINIYNADTTFRYVDGRVYETKDEAVKESKEEVEKEQREKNEYIDTIRVEWEE